MHNAVERVIAVLCIDQYAKPYHAYQQTLPIPDVNDGHNATKQTNGVCEGNAKPRHADRLISS